MKNNTNQNTRDKQDLASQNQNSNLEFDDLPPSPIETQAFTFAGCAAAIFLSINLLFSILNSVISSYINNNLTKNTGIELNIYISSARDDLEKFAENGEYTYWLSSDISTKQLERFLENNEIVKSNSTKIETLSYEIKQLESYYYEIDIHFSENLLKKHHTYKETRHPYAHSYYFMAVESKKNERRYLKRLKKIIIEANELLEEIRQVNRTYKDKIQPFKYKQKKK